MKTRQKCPAARIITVGKSMGSRVASQIVAEDRMDVSGLIFLGYPLTDQLRDARLYRIRVPMMYFAGTKNPLCNMDKLNSVLGNLPGPATWKSSTAANIL